MSESTAEATSSRKRFETDRPITFLPRWIWIVKDGMPAIWQCDNSVVAVFTVDFEIATLLYI